MIKQLAPRPKKATGPVKANKSKPYTDHRRAPYLQFRGHSKAKVGDVVWFRHPEDIEKVVITELLDRDTVAVINHFWARHNCSRLNPRVVNRKDLWVETTKGTWK